MGALDNPQEWTDKRIYLLGVRVCPGRRREIAGIVNATHHDTKFVEISDKRACGKDFGIANGNVLCVRGWDVSRGYGAVILEHTINEQTAPQPDTTNGNVMPRAVINCTCAGENWRGVIDVDVPE